MTEVATVIAFQPASGRIALKVGDGSFVLAEQTDATPVKEGAQLIGNMREFGPETWVDEANHSTYEVFVLGWDLSQEAIDIEM